MCYGVAWPVRYSILITEVSTPQRISRNSARILVSLNPWAVSVRALTMRWANRSTPPSNAKSSKTVAAGVMRPAAAARSSGGWPATTPNAATPTAAISAPSPLKGSTHPLRCPKLLNHKSRVHHMGSRPYLAVADIVDRNNGVARRLAVPRREGLQVLVHDVDAVGQHKRVVVRVVSEVLVLQNNFEPLDDVVRSPGGHRRPQRHVDEDAVVAHYGFHSFPVTLRERSPKI